MAEILRLEHLEKSFGTHAVLRGVDLRVEKGEVLSVIGSSGSGACSSSSSSSSSAFSGISPHSFSSSGFSFLVAFSSTYTPNTSPYSGRPCSSTGGRPQPSAWLPYWQPGGMGLFRPGMRRLG